MAINRVLAPTAAVASVFGAAFAPGVAAAQDGASPLVLSFEGSVGRGDPSKAYFEEKGGIGDVLDDDTAFVGSVGLSRSINENWDWKLSVSRRELTDNTLSDGDGFLATLSQGGARTGVDFTLGRQFTAGAINGRIGMGMAYAKATADKGLSSTNGVDFFRSDLDTEFQGVGPRLTLDLQSAPLSADGKVSLIGGAEVSMLSGKYRHSKGLEAFVNDGVGSIGPATVSDTASGKMTTAGVRIGLQYDANEQTAFRSGVRHDVTKMDRVTSGDITSVRDGVTSFFVGMDVSF